MKRKNLAIRQRTTLSQTLPDDHREKMAAFQAFVADQPRQRPNCQHGRGATDFRHSNEQDHREQGSQQREHPNNGAREGQLYRSPCMHCQWEKAAPHGNLQEEDGNQRQVTPPASLFIRTRRDGWIMKSWTCGWTDVMSIGLEDFSDRKRPACPRLNAGPYQRRHEREDPRHRFHPCCHPRRSDQATPAPGYLR